MINRLWAKQPRGHPHARFGRNTALLRTSLLDLRATDITEVLEMGLLEKASWNRGKIKQKYEK